MGPTWPNRMYWMTGTIDPDGTGGGPLISNKKPEGGLRWTTYAERLEKAGISWKAYQNELTRSGLAGQEDAWLSNFGDNVLECFAAYNVEAYPGYIPAAER